MYIIIYNTCTVNSWKIQNEVFVKNICFYNWMQFNVVLFISTLTYFSFLFIFTLKKKLGYLILGNFSSLSLLILIFMKILFFFSFLHLIKFFFLLFPPVFSCYPCMPQDRFSQTVWCHCTVEMETYPHFR